MGRLLLSVADICTVVVPKGPSLDRDPIEPGTVQTQIRDNSYTVCLQCRDTKQMKSRRWRQNTQANKYARELEAV